MVTIQNTVKLLVAGTIMAFLTACATNQIAEPRLTSIYNTTGFGGTQQDASAHAIRNANITCGDLPVTVISDFINEAKYQDSGTTVYEVNLRYRCGVAPATS